jgi:hypothetical protein
MKISEYFTYEELTTTQVRKLLDKNRKEGMGYTGCMLRLTENLLDPIREMFGPVIVHSCFRCPELNTAVGSTSKSQHLTADACDFHILGHLSGPDLYKIFERIWKRSGLKWHQLIWEYGWIHISNPTGVKDGQVLEIVGGKRKILQEGK